MVEGHDGGPVVSMRPQLFAEPSRRYDALSDGSVEALNRAIRSPALLRPGLESSTSVGDRLGLAASRV
jgi:hypothetical protein